MQLHIPSSVHDAVAIVTETLEPPKDDGSLLPFILDIDAVRKGSLHPNDPTLWERFEKLHALKNEIFFQTITEKTKALFQ